MSRLKALRKRIETAITRLALRWVPHWQRATVLRTARFLGHIGYLLPTALRRVGLTNLDLVYGEAKSKEEKQAILREAFQTATLVFLDIFWFAEQTRERIESLVTFDPQLDELFQRKAHMCITAHLGNWELLGHAVSVRGNPLSSVAAPLVNPAVDEYLARIRVVSGQIIIPRDGAIRGMLRTLKEDGKIGLLLDQNTRPRQGGIFVDFFGLPVPISDAGAVLALKTNADILFGYCIPKWDGTYYVHSCPKIIPSEVSGASKDEQVLKVTQAIATAIEQAIRAHPTAWLWMYKRWKHVPPDRSISEYPYYAKRAK